MAAEHSRREFVKMGAAVAGTVATWNATSYAKIVERTTAYAQQWWDAVTA